jgi:acyl-CoA hydrolase
MNHNEQNRSIIMSEIMTPEKANFAGNIHGGHLLSLLDRVAYACAARYSGHYVVTLSVDQVTFKQALHVGELITCYANVNYVGTTSMEVGIKVVAENLITQQHRHTNSCFFTMVAMDENHQPIKVTPLLLRDATDRRRYEKAKLRREMRLKFKQELQRREEEIGKIID